MRACTKCGEDKPFTEFYKHKTSKDGLHSHCKTCMRAASAAYRAANPEKTRAVVAQWRADNKEKTRSTAAAYRAANIDKVRAASAAWYAENRERASRYAAEKYAANIEKWRAASAAWYKANKEKGRAASASWRERNPEKRRASFAAWSASNRDKVRVNRHNRRARACNGKLSSGLTEKLFKLQRGKCACCGLPLGSKYHLDHIMPLALGGPNTDDNMQLLRQRCNLQKHAKHPIDFMQSRGFLL